MAVMPEKHSHPVPGGQAFWWTERLWALAAGLPVEAVDIESIPELDIDCWFGEGALRPSVPLATMCGALTRLTSGTQSS